MKCKNCDALVIQLIARLKISCHELCMLAKNTSCICYIERKNMKRSIFREKFTSDITGLNESTNFSPTYRGADKSLARPTSRCILFDGENISFDASLVIYIYIVIIFLQL